MPKHSYERANIPKTDPAARPILRAKIGGKTPSGFSLSVRPSLSKSIVSGKLIVIFERNPSSGYRTNGNDMVGVILSTVPGGSASRPSSVIQIKRFFRECGLFTSVDVSESSASLFLFFDSFAALTLPIAFELFRLILLRFWWICSMLTWVVELWSLECSILWPDTIEIITIITMALSHTPSTSMVRTQSRFLSCCAG